MSIMPAYWDKIRALRDSFKMIAYAHKKKKKKKKK